jgi:hypothetical protein
MKQAWDVQYWLRAADFWIEHALFSCDWQNPEEVAKSLRYYSDALNEVVL